MRTYNVHNQVKAVSEQEEERLELLWSLFGNSMEESILDLIV